MIISGIKVKALDYRHTVITDPVNYQILWITEGLESVTIDLETIITHPNSIIFITPARIARLKFGCKPPRGWILNFSRAFFSSQLTDGLNIKNVDIFHAYGQIPQIVVSPKIGDRIHQIAEMIAELEGSAIPNKEVAVSALLRTLLVYCDSRCNIKANASSNNNDLNLVSNFKLLVSTHFLKFHQVSDYARIMNVSPKYLNQVVKRVMGMSPKQIIQEQIVIQASRDLKFSTESIKEIAAKLGFIESEHFSHFFKKITGQSPSVYRQS